MKKMVCEICGNVDFVKKDDGFICKGCGTEYNVESAKKLLTEVQGEETSKSGMSSQCEKYLVLARRAHKEENHENATKYYGLVLEEMPECWEAVYFQMYYRVLGAKMGEILSMLTYWNNAISSSIMLLSKEKDQAEKNTGLATIVNQTAELIEKLRPLVFNSTFTTGAPSKNQMNKLLSTMEMFEKIFIEMENNIKKYFPNKKKELADAQKGHVKLLHNNGQIKKKDYRQEKIAQLTNEIRRYDSSYQGPGKEKGCYVATCVYGSYDCPQVWTLRRYRDNSLAQSAWGRTFIKVYYAVSPTLVKWFGNTAGFQKMWKGILEKKVRKLNESGVENTPYEDKNW